MNWKNRIIEVLKKDKAALGMLLLVPIIVPFFLHFVYGNIFVEDIPFAVVDLDNSSLSRNITQGLISHPGLDVCRFYESESQLEDSILRKKVIGGIIIPKGLSKDMNSPNSSKVLVVVDGSNMMTGGNASGYASQVIGTFNAGVQMNYLKGHGMSSSTVKNTMTSFSYTERVAYEPFLSYICNIVYIVIPFVIQTYYLTTFLLPAYVEEKHYWINNNMNRKEKRQRIEFLLWRILVVAVTICITSYLSFFIYAKIRNMPLRGSFLEYFALLFIFLMALSAIGLAISAFFNEKNLIYFIEFYFIISSMIVLTSGAVWPEYMMPSGMSLLIKSIWPFFHVAMPIKFVNLKGVGWETIMPYLFSCLIYFLVWLPIGLFFFKRKIRIKRGEPIEGDLLEG